MEDRQTSQRPTLRNRTTRNGGGSVVSNSVSAFSERKPKQYVTNTLQRQESLIQQFSVFRFLGMNYLISAKFITNNIFLQKKFSSVGSPEFIWVDTSEWFQRKVRWSFSPWPRVSSKWHIFPTSIKMPKFRESLGPWLLDMCYESTPIHQNITILVQTTN